MANYFPSIDLIFIKYIKSVIKATGFLYMFLYQILSVYHLSTHVMPTPGYWDIIIPLIKTGYRFKFTPSFMCKPSHSKIQRLQTEVPSLQRLATNVIRTCLNPGFYPNLCQVTCIPKWLKEYIMFEDILNL